jgi:hypothetical protein
VESSWKIMGGFWRVRVSILSVLAMGASGFSVGIRGGSSIAVRNGAKGNQV